MARSKWKYYYVNKKLFKYVLKLKTLKKKNKFLIYNRSSTILKTFLKKRFKIHKGLKFKLLKPKILHIGFKFGSFSFTRKQFYFPIKEKKKKFLKR